MRKKPSLKAADTANRPPASGKAAEPKAVQFYLDFLNEFEINLHTIMPAHGTAKTEILEYLGLTDDNKAVILNIIREDQIPAALAALDEKFRTIRNGKGIAFTVPLTGTIGVAIYQFLSNNRMTTKEAVR